MRAQDGAGAILINDTDTMTPTEAIAEIRKLKTDDEITEYSRSLPKKLRYSYEVQSQLRLRAMQILHETYQADPRTAYAYPWHTTAKTR